MSNLNIAKDILKKMDDIQYGYVDKNGEISLKLEGGSQKFANTYILQSPDQVRKSKVGVCWDQVEVEREYFKKAGVETKTYFIVYYDPENNSFPNHTFLTFKDEGKVYWIEHAWGGQEGVHEYATEEELLKDLKPKFVKSRPEIPKNYNDKKLLVFSYKKPKWGLGCVQFYQHCMEGTELVHND